MKDVYSSKWASHVDSPSRRRIKRDAYGNDYPAEVDPRSHVTWTELRRIVRELRIGPGDRRAPSSVLGSVLTPRLV
jgi:hypothetical protein